LAELQGEAPDQSESDIKKTLKAAKKKNIILDSLKRSAENWQNRTFYRCHHVGRRKADAWPDRQGFSVGREHRNSDAND
jgi:hypothetical protein